MTGKYFWIILIFCLVYCEEKVIEDEQKSGEKITGGQIVQSRTQFPYHVALLLKKGSVKDFVLCGGSIISPTSILTAAHCLFNADYSILIFGTHDLLLNDTNVLKFRVNSSDFKIHPNFNFHYAIMDIAHIHLQNYLKFNDFIQPVLLPNKNLLEESFAGEIATTSGHGEYCDENCGSSSVLRFTKNRVMGNEECRDQSPFGTFPTDSQICISTSEKDVGSSCKGDSGSGLTIERGGKKILIGVSSFGSRKCEDGKPAIFTRLTKEILDWIEEGVGKE